MSQPSRNPVYDIILQLDIVILQSAWEPVYAIILYIAIISDPAYDSIVYLYITIL